MLKLLFLVQLISFALTQNVCLDFSPNITLFDQSFCGTQCDSLRMYTLYCDAQDICYSPIYDTSVTQVQNYSFCPTTAEIVMTPICTDQAGLQCDGNCYLNTTANFTWICQSTDCNCIVSPICNMISFSTSYGSKIIMYEIALSMCSNSQNSKRSAVTSEAAMSESTFVSLQGEILQVIVSSPSVSGTVAISKGPILHAWAIQSTSLYLPLGPEYFDISGTLTVYLQFSDSSNSAYSFELVGRSTCIFQDCVYCWGAYDNFSCIPSSYKVAFWIVFVLILLLILLCLPVLVTLLANIIKCLFAPVCCIYRNAKKVHKIRAVKSTANFVGSKLKYFQVDPADLESQSQAECDESDPEADNTIDFYEEERKRKDTRVDSRQIPQPINKTMFQYKVPEKRTMSASRSIPKTSQGLLLCVCVAMVFTCVSGQSCGSGLTISSSAFTCTQVSPGQSTCSVGINSLITIQGIGQSACFTLVDPNNITIGNGIITYVAMTDTISLSKAYYTSDWYGVSQSSHRCNSAGGCSTDQCSQSQARNGNGNLNNPSILNFPGATICHSSCQCISCSGCVLCAPSCLYSGYGIVPQGDIYLVSSLSARTHSPIITVQFTTQNGNVLSGSFQTLLGATPVSNNYFSVSVVGTFASTFTEFGTNQVISDLSNGQNFLYTAAIVNQPNLGNTGDIQANSASNIGTQSATFRYTPTIVSYAAGDYSDTYTFHTSGVSQTKTFWTSLPSVVQGNAWSLSSASTLISNVTIAGAVAINLKTAANFQITRTINVVCPSGGTVTASGCYNCNSGVVLVLQGTMSTCSSGAVQITSDMPYLNILTTSIVLTQYSNGYKIYATTSQSAVQGNLILTGTGSSIKIPVSFTATFQTTVSNDTTYSNSGVSSQNNGQGDSLSGFQSFYSLGGSITSKILTVIKIIATIMVGALIIYLAYYMIVLLFRYHKTHRPYQRVGEKLKSKFKPEKLKTESPSGSPVVSSKQPDSLRKRVVIQ